jgi:hypothetical protein
VVTSISPVSGPTSGGTVVTITGTGFALGATVTFGGVAATPVFVLSTTAIQATTPPGTAGAVNVMVTVPATGTATLAAGFTYVAPPPPPPPPPPTGVTASVIKVQPTEGQVAGGSPVTVHGANFQSGATVAFGGVGATNVTVVDAYTLTCTTPAGGPGSVSIVVTNAGATPSAPSGVFTYVRGLRFDAVAPISGPTTGSVVTLTGVGFQSGASVTFDGLAATNVSVPHEYHLVCTTPPHLPLAVTVAVTNPTAVTPTGGFAAQSAQRARAYSYTGTGVVPGPAAPVVPAEGPAAGGTTVTLTGAGFLAGATVAFGAVPATNVQVLSGSVITCTAPAAQTHVTPVVGVTVTNPNATTWSAVPPVAGYVYRPAPVSLTQSGDYGSFGPAVAVDGNGALHVAWAQKEMQGGGMVLNIRHRRSTDGGRTWSAAQVLYTGGYWGTTTPTFAPQIAAAGSSVMVVWPQGSWNTQIQRSEMAPWSAHSTDGGQTWSTAAKLSTFVATQWISTWPVDVAITPGGTVVVVAEAPHNGAVWPPTGVYLSTGTIGGSYTTPLLLSSTTRNAGAARIALQGNSTWHVAWTAGAGSGPGIARDCYYRRTTNGGTAWSTAVALSTSGGAWSAHLAANGQRVVAGWCGQSSAGLTLRSSTNGGTSFGTAVALNTPGGDWYSRPRLALDGGAAVLACYSGYPGSGITGLAECFVQRSGDGGATWSAPVNCSLLGFAAGVTAPAKDPVSVWTGTRFFAVWTDPALGNALGRIAGY